MTEPEAPCQTRHWAIGILLLTVVFICIDAGWAGVLVLAVLLLRLAVGAWVDRQ